MSDRETVKVVIAVQWDDDFDPDDRISPSAAVVVEQLNVKYIHTLQAEVALAAAVRTAVKAWIAKEMYDAS